MAKTAKSISAANLTKLTQAAVKAATKEVPGRFLGKGPTMGYILRDRLTGDGELALATEIASGLSANARAAGVTGLKAQPVVVIRPGRIIAGFLTPELGIPIRG
jgi:hypothetical protein